MYFPKRNEGDNKEDLFREILVAKCNLFLDESKDNEENFQRLYEQYKELSKPLSFWPHNPKNDWVRFKNHFEKMYAILEENGVKAAKNLTVYEFYSRLEYLKEKAQEANKVRK